jgi:hypothetical protein
MATRIYFNVSASDGSFASMTVKETAAEVQNAWEAKSGRHELLHLTRRRDGKPLVVHAANVAGWAETRD